MVTAIITAMVTIISINRRAMSRAMGTPTA